KLCRCMYSRVLVKRHPLLRRGFHRRVRSKQKTGCPAASSSGRASRSHSQFEFSVLAAGSNLSRPCSPKCHTLQEDEYPVLTDTSRPFSIARFKGAGIVDGKKRPV